MWAPEQNGAEEVEYLAALGLKTLHMGQVLVACWSEPTA